MKIAATVGFVVLGIGHAAGGARAAPEDPAPAPAAAPAVGPERLAVCFDVASDGSPVYPTREVPSANRELRAAFRLREGERIGKMASEWVAVDVGAAAPPNASLGKTEVVLGTERSGSFRFTLPRDLPAGTYRLSLSAEGKPWASLDFRVVPSRPVTPLATPASLLPLEPGTSWTYALAAEVSRGVTFPVPGAQTDAQGVQRASLVYDVASREGDVARIRMRVGEPVTAEEAWSLSERGLALVKRWDGAKETNVDPPRVLFPLPLRPVAAWRYRVEDGTEKGEARAWGPVPVEGPAGVVDGWVVLTTEPQPFAGYPAVKSTERHYVAGIGIVREVIVLSLRAKRLVRMENVLKAPPSGAPPPR